MVIEKSNPRFVVVVISKGRCCDHYYLIIETSINASVTGDTIR